VLFTLELSKIQETQGAVPTTCSNFSCCFGVVVVKRLERSEKRAGKMDDATGNLHTNLMMV